MGVLVGLMFGCGLLSLWLWAPTASGFKWADDVTNAGSRGQAVEDRAVSTRNRLRKFGVASGLALALIGFLLTGLLIVGALAGVVGAFVPVMVAKRKERREAQRRREAWPDVIDGLVSAVRAGMSLPEAVAAVGDRGPVVVRPLFEQFAHDYRSTGRFGESIARLRGNLADPVADRIVEALLAARDVGGSDLGRMLRTLSDFVRQDLRLRGEAEARRSWTVNGARLAIAAPWIVLLLLSTRPDAAAAYQTTAGMFVIVGCAVACTLAYALMTKIGRLPDEQRVML